MLEACAGVARPASKLPGSTSRAPASLCRRNSAVTFSTMTDAQIAYFHSYPVWMTADWAIGVWSSVVGSVLLLLRSRYAFPAFVLSLLAIIVSLVYQYVLSPPAEGVASMTIIMQCAITVAL